MSRKFLITVLSLVIEAVSVTAAASDLDDAVDAMHHGDFAEAFCLMRPFADAGDADAQYNIGWMYLNGYGLRVDEQKALEWWLRASEQGHIDASFSIGMLYSLGEGKVVKDVDKAIDYYLLAIEGDQEDAIMLLQNMMMRNDREIRGRMHAIIDQHGALFGSRFQVKAKKLNARSGPSINDEIVAELDKGQFVLELFRKGSWSQVVLLGMEQIDQTVWVYSPLLEAVDITPDSIATGS